MYICERENVHLWTGECTSVDGEYEAFKKDSLKRNFSLKGLGQRGIPQSRYHLFFEKLLQ